MASRGKSDQLKASFPMQTQETEINPVIPSFRRSAETELLMNYLPTIQEGEVKTYGELQNVALLPDSKKGRDRLTAALAVARKNLESKGVVFGAVNGVGIKRLNPQEMVHLGTNTVTRAHRLAKRGVKRLTTVQMERLPQDMRSQLNVKLSQLAVIAHAVSRKASNTITQGVLQNHASFDPKEALALMLKHE